MNLQKPTNFISSIEIKNETKGVTTLLPKVDYFWCSHYLKEFNLLLQGEFDNKGERQSMISARDPNNGKIKCKKSLFIFNMLLFFFKFKFTCKIGVGGMFIPFNQK
jgi:hypothetical protein